MKRGTWVDGFWTALLAVVVLTAVIMLVSSCGSRDAGAQDGAALEGGWYLVRLKDEPLIPDTIINATFADGDEQITGFSGCNSYGASYSREGRGLKIAEMAMTAMACLEPEGVMAQEQAYADAVQQVTAYRIDDEGRLELLNGSGAVLLAYVRQPAFEGNPDALVGPTWRLVTLDGNPLDEDLNFILTFDEATYSGLADCRHLEGGYQASSGEIRFTSISMEETECPDAGDDYYEIEGRFTDALTWARRWRIVESRLEIHTARGAIMVFAE